MKESFIEFCERVNREFQEFSAQVDLENQRQEEQRILEFQMDQVRQQQELDDVQNQMMINHLMGF